MTKKELILTGLEFLGAFVFAIFLLSTIEHPTPEEQDDDDMTGRIVWRDPNAPEATTAITTTPTPWPTERALLTETCTNTPTPEPTATPTPEPTATPTPTPALSRTQPDKKKNHDFKPYTRYTAYNLKSSQQYKLQKAAWTETRTGIRTVTDPNGVDRYCVALGTAWAGGQPKHIGRCLDVYMKNGAVLHCVLADVKRQEDTVDGANLYGKTNNDVLEFIVDDQKISQAVKTTGNVSKAGPEFVGSVDRIEVFDLWIEGFGG